MGQQLNFSDSAIAHIVKLLQIAILSGTDIVDHMRQMSFVSDDEGHLSVSTDSEAILENTIHDMLKDTPEEAAEIAETAEVQG